MAKEGRSRSPRAPAPRRRTDPASSQWVPTGRAWFTVSQLCQRWQLGRKTIYKFIDNKILPAWKVGPHLYRIAVADVLRFEEQNRLPTK